MTSFLFTAGEELAFSCGPPWVSVLVAEGAAGAFSSSPRSQPSITISVEDARTPFRVAGWKQLSRGAWHRSGALVAENVCATGFDMHLACGEDRAEFTFRWRPPVRERAARLALRSRFHLLARAALIQYPALWWAGTRGRVPLHASACTSGTSTSLVTGPSGVGRSTLIMAEVAAGGRSTGDNLAVSDGTTVWGLVEPLRVTGIEGRRMPHGRREILLGNRCDSLVPTCLAVLDRSSTGQPSIYTCSDQVAARALIANTYMAGELRRYWAFAATCAAGTGIGPAHPPLTDVAFGHAHRLPCFLVRLGAPGSPLLATMIDEERVGAWL